MGMVTVEYMGKKVQKEEVVPGVVKTGNAYLVQCSVTKEWTYCNQERLDKLVAKKGSIEKLGQEYVGRNGKRIQNGTEPVKAVVEEESTSEDD